MSESNNTHTPGPWKFDETTLSICRLLVSVEDVAALQVYPDADPQWIVAYLPFDRETEIQLANVRLIATAPELLSEAKGLLEALEMEGADSREFSDWVDGLRDAITKAEGH